MDSLRRLSPVSDAEAAAVWGALGREELLEDVTRLPVGDAERRRAVVRRRPLVVALAVVAVAATAATAWAVLGSSAHETTSVECVIAGSDTIIPSTSGDPAYDCAVAWQQDLGTVPPPLVAYDNSLGGVSVLPRGTTPPAGWKRLSGGQDVALIELQESLDDYIAGLNSGCLDGPAATALAERNLARFGLTGWSVSVRDDSPATQGARFCASADIVDPATRTVTLTVVGTPPRSGTVIAKLADRLRPLTQNCESLPAAVASVQAAASDLGLSESARTYKLDTVTDDSLRCASIYETVGGTIFLTVRGPSSSTSR
jgi:hypothetical protein